MRGWKTGDRGGNCNQYGGLHAILWYICIREEVGGGTTRGLRMSRGKRSVYRGKMVHITGWMWGIWKGSDTIGAIPMVHWYSNLPTVCYRRNYFYIGVAKGWSTCFKSEEDKGEVNSHIGIQDRHTTYYGSLGEVKSSSTPLMVIHTPDLWNAHNGVRGFFPR